MAYVIEDYEDVYEKPLTKVTALVVGKSGTGKTTWLSSVPLIEDYAPMLILAFDRSTRSVVNRAFLDIIGWEGNPRDYPLTFVPVETIDDVNEVYKDLVAGKINWRGQPFKSVGLDNLSESQLRITSQLLRTTSPVNNRPRKDVPGRFDYRVVKNITYQYMDSYIYRLPGVHIFATADIYEDKDDDGKITNVDVSISAALQDVLPRLFDVIGQIKMRGDARYLTTKKTSSFRILRDKTNSLPDEVTPLWPEMYQYMAGMIVKEAAPSQPSGAIKRLA